MSINRMKQDIIRDKKKRKLICELATRYCNKIKEQGSKIYYWPVDFYCQFENKNFRELYAIRKKWDTLEKIHKKYSCTSTKEE